MHQAALLAVAAEDGHPDCLRRLLGISLLLRNLRLLHHCGVTRAVVLVRPTNGRIEAGNSDSTPAFLQEHIANEYQQSFA